MANVKIDNLADEIMKGLKGYADLATDDLKKSVPIFKIPTHKFLRAYAVTQTPHA